jgi:uncharacterized membrane protein YhaH (DUF805 family)
MKVQLEHVPASTLDSLKSMLAQGGPGRGAVLHRPSLRWLGIMGGISAAAGLLGIVVTASMMNDPNIKAWVSMIAGAITILFLLYAFAAARDHVLRRRHGLGAFILVTPCNLVRCWGGHLPIEFFRLKEATEYKTTQEYDEKQRYKGRRFRFLFGKQAVDFVVADPKEIAALDEVAEWAKAKGRGESLPDVPGAQLPDLMPAAPEAQESGLVRGLLDPRSEFWLLMGALLIVGVLVAIIASRRR